MSIHDDNATVIVAGGSGLVGNELMKILLDDDPIGHIYALVRKPLPYFHPKLEQIQHSDLQIVDWSEDKKVPKFGFICLGTTIKQAGSKAELKRIDYELVCSVAQEMKVLGVSHLAVVSSYGASLRSFSHYLRTKGKMEEALRQMEFEHLVFVRPGPLKGLRDEPRTDEAIVQGILKVFSPVMIGPLAKLIPISATDVARSMLFSLFRHSSRKVETLNSVDMKNMLNLYQ